MTTRTITLDSNDFFHARPAARIAVTAKRYESVAMLMLGTAIADAKDAVSLMRLGHPNGSALEVMTDGPDEQTAMSAVLEAIEQEFSIKNIV